MPSIAWIKIPKNRIKAAICLIIVCAALMVVNVALYLFKVIDSETLILITLILSWIAPIFQAVDILATSDVRSKQ
jgi:hypothetical protein